jgi:hypothetical protein
MPAAPPPIITISFRFMLASDWVVPGSNGWVGQDGLGRLEESKGRKAMNFPGFIYSMRRY